jgi:hypothetical protein
MRRFYHLKHLRAFLVLISIAFTITIIDKAILNKELNLKSMFDVLNKQNHSFNFSPADHTLVLFHIQKTSGTAFDLDMVNNMHVSFTNKHGFRVTRKACWNKTQIRSIIFKQIKTYVECNKTDRLKESLLLSKHTSFEWSCGLHPGLSDLKRCLGARLYVDADRVTKMENFVFVTLLREPLERFVSELRHIQKTGSLWIYELQAISRDQTCLKSNYTRLFVSNHSF